MQHDAMRGGIVGRGLRRLRSRRGLPDVTVVVGCTERDRDLLPGCLESLQRQTHPHVHVLVSPEEPEEAAAARSRYLLFLAASERLEDTALADLVAALEGSGSDLALAGLRQLDGSVLVPPHRTGVTLAAAPEAFTVQALGATLFRRRFFEQEQLRPPIPDAPAAPLLVRACARAGHLDLVGEVVCQAADRATELPFGHVPHLADAMHPWLDAVTEVDIVLRAAELRPARLRWLSALLDAEAPRFVDATEQTDPDQWERLCGVLGPLADELAATPEAWAGLRWTSRVKARLVTQRARGVLEDFVESRRRQGEDVHTEVRDGRVYAIEPTLAAAGLPDDCLELTPAETPLVASLRQLHWDDGTLQLDVFGYPRLVGDQPGRPEPELSAELVDGVRRTTLKVTPTPNPAATRFAKERHQTHDLAGYRISVTADQVAEAGSWRLELTWRGHGLTRTGTVNHRDHNGRLGDRPRRLSDGLLWGPGPDGDAGLVVEAERPGAVLASATVAGREISGRLVDAVTRLTEVEIAHTGEPPMAVPVRSALDDAGVFTATLPDLGYANRDGEAGEWRLTALDAAGARHPVAFPPDVDGDWIREPTGVLAWRRSRGGAAAVREVRHRPEVRDARLVGDHLVLTVGWLGEVPEHWTMTLVGARVRLTGDTRGTGKVVFATTCDEWGLGPATAPCGAYHLELGLPDVDATGGVEVADELARRTPVELLGERLRVRVRQSPRHRLVLHVMPPLHDDELGVRAQQLQQERYAAASYSPDPQVAYFQSYTGHTATDSPLAIHDRLRRTYPRVRSYWGIEDWSAQVPDGAVPVLMRSREWYDVLGSAGHLVANIDFDDWFVKRPGQRLLQTFHGYPAKTMGLVQWRAKRFGERRIEAELDRTARKWDLILTPSPEMDEHYRREYAYGGPIHHQGYPRDDLLVSPEAAAVRAETRRRLGITPEQTVVLFAPTFRDHLAVDHRAAVLADHLDLEGASEVLGPDYVLLMRGHRFHAKGERRLARTRRLVDVTDYPEVNHLILAADVAVLDYSSLRFDFALTGRPMVFLVPDLEVYSGPVRGFLYDFESSAPGPLVRDAAEVVELLRDVDGLAARYAEEIGAFTKRFQGFQDGRAAERVVDAFFASAELEDRPAR